MTILENDPRLLKLGQLQSEILDVFLEEANPKKWPSIDTPAGRGDRYWLKQNALLSSRLLTRFNELRFLHAVSATPEDQETVDELVAASEAHVKELLAKMDGK